MEGKVEVTVEQLKALAADDLDGLLQQVADSVNKAAPGRLIADSEELTRIALREFGQAVFERAVQQKVNAAEAAFSLSAGQSDGPAVQGPRPAEVQGGDGGG